MTAFGHGFAQMTPRLLKGTLVLAQGELSTREYERTIELPIGKKHVKHVVKQLAVELKADTIRILDRSSSIDGNDLAEVTEHEVPS